MTPSITGTFFFFFSSLFHWLEYRYTLYWQPKPFCSVKPMASQVLTPAISGFCPPAPLFFYFFCHVYSSQPRLCSRFSSLTCSSCYPDGTHSIMFIWLSRYFVRHCGLDRFHLCVMCHLLLSGCLQLSLCTQTGPLKKGVFLNLTTRLSQMQQL